MPIALPDFVGEPGVPDPGMGRNITQIIAANLRRSGLFAPIDQAAYIERITDINRNAALRGLAADQRPGAGDRPPGAAGQRQCRGAVPAVGRVRGRALHAPAIRHQPGQLAPHRAHHLRRDLPAADRREGLLRHPRRLRRRVRPEGPAHQAARDHGSGRRQCALPHARRRSRADAALLAVDAGNHLHVVRAGRAARLPAQHRDRPARGGRQFPRHDVRAALLARRPARDHEPAAGRQLQHLRDGSALARHHEADRHRGDRHRAVLFAGRRAHLFRIRSRRPPADLRDGRQRRAGATASASARARIRRRSGRRAATTSPSPSRRRAGSRSAS